MSARDSKKKTHIIDTVLKMISEGGDHNFTTREIAAKAKVNIAAINYYFGSKDDLIKLAEEDYFRRIADVHMASIKTGKNVEETLLNYCIRYSEFVLANPGLQRNMMSRIISDRQARPEISIALQNNVIRIKNVLRDTLSRLDDKTLNHISVIFLSAVFYPILLTQYESELNIDLEYKDREKLKGYYKTLIDCILSCT
ncbi:MAG: TetR/AcrR family transcriptional regulator [Dehalococcoidia bacterium]|nr:TetR/AcrR family transcriptional regulator [Dehalococcoidia bacterium]